MTKSTITDKRVTSVIERLEHFASNLKWTNVRGAQDLLTAADGLRELQERRKADSEPVVYMWDSKRNDIDVPGFYFPEHLFFAESNVKQWGGEIDKLYRHAQQPVVDADDNFYSWFGREWQENYQHNQYTTAAKQMLGVMAESAWIAATERQRQKQSVSVPDVKIYEDVPYEVGRFKTHRDCYCDGWNACSAAMLQAGNSPVIGIDLAAGPDRTVEVRYVAPPGYVMVPKEPTETMINAWLSEVANWRGHVAGYKAMLAAAQHDTPALNSLQSVVTVSDTWIPVSERMPENKPGCYKYLVFETLNNRVNHDYWNVPDKGDEAFAPFWNYYGEHVTHWMPLPAAPKELK